MDIQSQIDKARVFAALSMTKPTHHICGIKIEQLADTLEKLCAANELCWEALRWADSPDEGDPCDQWTEIPRDAAQKAFEALNAVRNNTGDRQWTGD